MFGSKGAGDVGLLRRLRDRGHARAAWRRPTASPAHCRRGSPATHSTVGRDLVNDLRQRHPVPGAWSSTTSQRACSKPTRPCRWCAARRAWLLLNARAPLGGKLADAGLDQPATSWPGSIVAPWTAATPTGAGRAGDVLVGRLGPVSTPTPLRAASVRSRPLHRTTCCCMDWCVGIGAAAPVAELRTIEPILADLAARFGDATAGGLTDNLRAPPQEPTAGISTRAGEWVRPVFARCASWVRSRWTRCCASSTWYCMAAVVDRGADQSLQSLR